MSEPSRVTEGACSSCGAQQLLREGGLYGRPLCPRCTFFHGLAPDVHAEYKRRRLGVVTIEGKKIRVGGGLRATLMIAQQMAKKSLREATAEAKGAGKA